MQGTGADCGKWIKEINPESELWRWFSGGAAVDELDWIELRNVDIKAEMGTGETPTPKAHVKGGMEMDTTQ